MNASPLVLSPSGPPAITAPAADPATTANSAQGGGADSTFSVAMQNAGSKPLRKSASSKSSDGNASGAPLPVTGNHSPPLTVAVPPADPRPALAQRGAVSSPSANGVTGVAAVSDQGGAPAATVGGPGTNTQPAAGALAAVLSAATGAQAPDGTEEPVAAAGATGTAAATAAGGSGGSKPAISFDTPASLPGVDVNASEGSASTGATAAATPAVATAAAVAAADSGRSAGLGAIAAGSVGAAVSAPAGASGASASAKGVAGAAGRLGAKAAVPSVRTPAAAGAVAAGGAGDDDAPVAGSASVASVAPAATRDDESTLAASAAAQAAANPAGPASGADVAGDAGLGVTAAAASAAPATVVALTAARAAASAAGAQGVAALAAGSGADKHVSAAAGVSVAGAGAGAEAGAGNAVGTFPLNATTASGAATDTAATPTLQLHAGLDSGEFAQDLSDRVTYLVGNGMNGAKLQVNPPQLGPIELRIAVSGDHAQVWMTTHSAVTRDALESSSPKLREMLGAQGFGAVSVNISQRSFQDRSSQAQPYQRTASVERSGAAPLAAGANPGTGLRAPSGSLDAYA
jgi:flagellar hook-length control protein FliK